ncbi:DUF58 domain-containing protein [Pseudoalteromonas luteoviolacea]|uniref:Uncharacterized protein n=1 Tax=Pseudoalteromonas luteoviolacea S4060-1 TaxID=1365257 RepID=A0A167LET3_9GAMM|nr:DUF58 domain-containing protein [Pseudoalteromonas luteoviolacea]KZN64393.1 hypothetical protein N478_22115 [Pseudoalteromonas luteoviolacea S4060-1]
MALGSYKDWLNGVITKKHSANTITLSHENIYVVPSKSGFLFLFFALLNFVIGINYQNNLILGVAYLMLMLQISALFYGYMNLHGMRLELLDIQSNFVGNHNLAKFRITPSAEVYSLNIFHSEFDNLDFRNKHFDVKPQNQIIKLHLERRGKYSSGKFKIQSSYPFGLVNVWSYLLPNKQFYVYPAPLKCELDIQSSLEADTDTGVKSKRSDSFEDFSSLTKYQKGMSKNRISWRHFAKSQELLVKDYEGEEQSISHVLDFFKVEGGKETKLSKLCYQVLEADKQGHEFALKLPNAYIKMGSGESHVTRCLEALSEC